MPKKRAFAIIYLALIALILAIAWFNFINLTEAFGDGPPYYARTTNMDKWTNPLPTLATIDIIAAIVIALAIYRYKR